MVFAFQIVIAFVTIASCANRVGEIYLVINEMYELENV